MSLLEDIFLRDEAEEAQELERVIEGDEYDERPRSRSDSDDNSEKEGEAEEEKRRVNPSSTKSKRVIKNPRFTLNPARLTGPRGIQIIPEHFKDFKFKGKGHEKDDLDLVLKKLEHWAYRLYPKFEFEDCLKKIETLGKKRPVMVHLHKIRSDQYISEETVVQKDSSDDELPVPPQEEDEFDKLLQQQIELARSTPAPGSVKKPDFDNSVKERSISLHMPKVTSSPSISEEQKERMLRNRKLAEERRLARLKNNSNISEKTDKTDTYMSLTEKVAGEETNREVHGENIIRRHNKNNVIDSSDGEDCLMSVNESVRVDIHNSVNSVKVADNTPYVEDNTAKGNHEDNTDLGKKLNNMPMRPKIIDFDVNKHQAEENENIIRRHSKNSVIDSSDEEDCLRSVNESVKMDIHSNLINPKVADKAPNAESNIANINHKDNTDVDKGFDNVLNINFGARSIDLDLNKDQMKCDTKTLRSANSPKNITKENINDINVDIDSYINYESINDNYSGSNVNSIAEIDPLVNNLSNKEARNSGIITKSVKSTMQLECVHEAIASDPSLEGMKGGDKSREEIFTSTEQEQNNEVVAVELKSVQMEDAELEQNNAGDTKDDNSLKPTDLDEHLMDIDFSQDF